MFGNWQTKCSEKIDQKFGGNLQQPKLIFRIENKHFLPTFPWKILPPYWKSLSPNMHDEAYPEPVLLVITVNRWYNLRAQPVNY